MENTELYHYGVAGMRWGVRRYQNRDGTLTEKGRRRMNRDFSENPDNYNFSNKKGNSNSKNPNSYPKRFVKEDMERTKKLADSSVQATQSLNKATKTVSDMAPKKRMDLSQMSDKEMRDRINREYLERQYSDMFTPQKEQRGREALQKTLTVVGEVAAVTSSALAIALSIRELRG